jgi:hypothetical protein
MLPSACFSNDSFRAKPFRQQCLSNGVVNFVCTGMSEIFTL